MTTSVTDGRFGFDALEQDGHESPVEAFGLPEPLLTAEIGHVLDHQVIPRLMALNRAVINARRAMERLGDPAYPADAMRRRPRLSSVEVDRLVSDLTLRPWSDRSALYAELRERGYSFEQICADLMAPAARVLGALWEDDKLSFTVVSAALVALHADLQTQSDGAAHCNPCGALEDCARRILLIGFPGDRHVFGVTMLAELFRKDGWHVELLTSPDPEDARRLMRDEWFDLVGVSLARAELLGELKSFIENLRKDSRNRQVKIMAGGAAFFDEASDSAMIGADETSLTGQEAIIKANMLVETRNSQTVSPI